MDNKVLVNLVVPELGTNYDIFLPVNKKIGNIIILLNKAVNELSGGIFPISDKNKLYNIDTKKVYSPNILLLSTDIRNGTKLLLIS